MGQDGVDTDLPTQFELLCLNNILGKILFSCVLCLSGFYLSFLSLLIFFLEHSKYYFMLYDRHSFVRSALRAGTCLT